LTVDYNLDLASAGLMAKDGRCKPFSQQADGFARVKVLVSLFCKSTQLL